MIDAGILALGIYDLLVDHGNYLDDEEYASVLEYLKEALKEDN